MDQQDFNLGGILGLVIAAGLLGAALRKWRRPRAQERYDLWSR